MADLKISELSALAGANLVAADELAIVDDSASETKKITVSDLIANGVTVISDDSIPGAKILFGAGDIATAALADSAVTTAKVADDAITAAKLANESTVDLVTTLPAAGAFTGQLALDTDDNNVYLWDGSAWRGIAAPGSIGNINGSTTGEINIVVTTSGTAVTISATLDNTTSAAQFLAGPTGSAGAVGYRTLVGTDLPAATSTAKGGVIVNGNGLTMDGDTIEVNNSVTASSTNHVVTYDANGLITGGRTIIASDLPLATTTAVGAVSVGDGLAVGAGGELSVDNAITPGTYTKVTVSSKGLVTSATTLAAADIPDHSAAKLTSGTIGTTLIANDAITADKIGDQATTKFGGAAGSDNVTIFPTGDYKGQFFYDETTQDLYIYTGSAFVPITVLSGNLVNAGAYNANTNQMSSVTSAGSSAGFSVGNALPAPAKTNLNHYVVVDTSGTGTGAAPAVALAPPDMLLSQGVGTEYSLIDVSNAIAGQTASNISLIATGDITATDVQAGITELDTEKLPKAGGTMTGNLELNNANVVFEGSSADDYETTLTVTNPTADRTITLPNITGTVVTTGDTGSVTSTMITDGTIVNADINASAEIAVSKLANGTARQLLQTAANGSDVEFTSNVDVPGTLDVTAAATFDSTVAITGLISANGKVSFPAGTAAAPGIYSGSDTDTGIYSPGSNQFGISTEGTAALTIDSSQRVGIGTTAPGSNLDIEEDGASANAELAINYTGSGSGRTSAIRLQRGGTNFAYISGATFALTSGNNDDLAIAPVSGKNLLFGIGNSEKIRLDSAGRLLVGTSTDISGGIAGEISQVISSAGGGVNLGRNDSTVAVDELLGVVNFYSYGGSSWQKSGSIKCEADAAQGDDDKPGRLVFSTTADGASSPTERLRISSDGTITAAGFADFTRNAGDGFGYLGIGPGGTNEKAIFVNRSGEIDLELYSNYTSSATVSINSDGSITAAGNPTLGKNLGSLSTNSFGTRIGATASGTETPGLLVSFRNTNASGTVAQFGGTVGDVLIKGDGSITTTGSVDAQRLNIRGGSGGKLIGFYDTSDNEVGKITPNGGAEFDSTVNALKFTGDRTGSDTVFSAKQSGVEKASISADGSATFAGSVEISNSSSLNELAFKGTDYTNVYSETTAGFDIGINSTSSAYLRFLTNNVEAIRIDSSGNVGIGQTSNGSGAKLEVRSTTGSIRNATLRVNGGLTTSGAADTGATLLLSGNHGGGERDFGSVFAAKENSTLGNLDTYLAFGTRSNGGTVDERMRITSGGELHLGSGIIGDTSNGEGIRCTPGGFIGLHNVTTSGAASLFQAKSGSTTKTLRMQIKCDGDLENANNSYTGFSDIKLKENVVDANSQWDDIKLLRVRNFNFKAETNLSTHTQIGLVAQEVEPICPGLIGESTDLNEEGSSTGTVTKSVAYSVLYMKAVKALQEAMERIETLETKVAQLEAG